MNIHGITKSTFTNINNTLFEGYKKAADLSMENTYQEIKDDLTNLKTDDGMTMYRIYTDGS